MIVDVDFPDHWKTRMLVDLLDGDEAAPVYLLRLWAHCQIRKQWVFAKLPALALKALCRFRGDADKLESSLAAAGFVVRDAAGIVTICSWDEYNASLIANWGNGKKGGRPRKPKRNPSKTHGYPTANPNETDREEKRREDTQKEREELDQKNTLSYSETVTDSNPRGGGAGRAKGMTWDEQLELARREASG